MGKRGRKKGGLSINELDDREEITKMIINQINSLNKKIIKFKTEGIEEHTEYVKNIISSDMGVFTANDTLSKSKKFYENKETIWLKKSLAAIHKLNNHEFFGTVNKYKKEVTKGIKAVQDYTQEYLKLKGYDEKFINEITNSKDFIVKLYDAYNEKDRKYGSNQIIEKIALSYEDTGLTNEETNKILSNIEYGKVALDRIKEEKEAFEEFKRNKKMR